MFLFNQSYYVALVYTILLGGGHIITLALLFLWWQCMLAYTSNYKICRILKKRLSQPFSYSEEAILNQANLLYMI